MRSKPLLLAGILAAQATSLHGASVAVNLTNTNFAATQIQGAENTNALDALLGTTTTSWNNVAISSNNGAALIDLVGTDISLGTVTLKYHARNGWLGGSEGTSGNDASQQVFRIYLDDGDDQTSYMPADGFGVTLQLSNLAAYMSANSATGYFVSLVYATDTNSTTFRPAQIRSGLLNGTNLVTDLTLLSTTATPTVLANGGYAPFDNTVGTGAGGTRGYVNTGTLTADQITIAVPSSGTGRGTIAGFVITTVPEPTSVSLIGLGLCLGFVRRSRK